MVNLFKQNDGFTPSTFTGLTKDGVEQIPDEIKDSLIQVDKETYNKLQNHELMWKDGELVSNPDYQEYVTLQFDKEQHKKYLAELRVIQRWFTDNDWKPNKIITGEWQADDPRWIEYLNERTTKRTRQDALNELLQKNS